MEDERMEVDANATRKRNADSNLKTKDKLPKKDKQGKTFDHSTPYSDDEDELSVIDLGTHPHLLLEAVLPTCSAAAI